MSDAAQILNSEFEEFAYFNPDEIENLLYQVFIKEVRGKSVPFVKCLVRDKALIMTRMWEFTDNPKPWLLDVLEDQLSYQATIQAV